MSFTALLHLHATTVLVSLLLFLLRGYWMWTASAMLGRTWVRVVPHLNDFLLLGAGIGMLVVAGLNPLHNGWLMAKIVALLVYIGLGTVALKRGKTPAQRRAAFIAALAIFAYIVAVAVTRQVMPFPG